MTIQEDVEGKTPTTKGRAGLGFADALSKKNMRAAPLRKSKAAYQREPKTREGPTHGSGINAAACAGINPEDKSQPCASGTSDSTKTLKN